MSTGDAAETRAWRVLNLELGLEEPEAVLLDRACRAAGVDPSDVRGMRIARRSVDARRRGGERRIRYVVHVDVVLADGERSAAFRRAERSGRVRPAPDTGSLEVADTDPGARRKRAVVIGAGPGGLFAALVLGLAGVEVDLLDRGKAIRPRGSDLVRFHRSRVPDAESNLLFGEGGAGTYSDGKLYTRVDDPLEVPCLETLVACGAPPDIVYDARAHIGTDRLHRVVPALRERMEDLGVRFHWNTRLVGLDIAPGDPVAVRGLVTTEGLFPCDAVILSTGHSARDTWRMLADHGVVLQPKPFQLGVRIEHPQELVDRGRYGAGAEAALLGPASYNLSCRPGGGSAGAHSFCMCPGGRIVASVHDPGLLCTNGMSNAAHSSPWANAAVVTTLKPGEHFGQSPFDGVELQAELERRFFDAGGGDYTAPAQSAEDYVAGRESRDVRKGSYTFGVVPRRIDELLPEHVRDALRNAIRRFDRGIPGFAGPDGVLVGLESRSSGPVRMPRDPDSRRAAGFRNLYPVGEGAGYAGGIMSSAIDGARSAQAFLRSPG